MKFKIASCIDEGVAVDCTSDNIATDHLYIMCMGPTSVSVLLSQLGGEPVGSNRSQRSSPRRAEAVVSSRQRKEAALVSCLIESWSRYSHTVAQLQWASLSLSLSKLGRARLDSDVNWYASPEAPRSAASRPLCSWETYSHHTQSPSPVLVGSSNARQQHS